MSLNNPPPSHKKEVITNCANSILPWLAGGCRTLYTLGWGRPLESYSLAGMYVCLYHLNTGYIFSDVTFNELSWRLSTNNWLGRTQVWHTYIQQYERIQYRKRAAQRTALGPLSRTRKHTHMYAWHNRSSGHQKKNWNSFQKSYPIWLRTTMQKLYHEETSLT